MWNSHLLFLTTIYIYFIYLQQRTQQLKPRPGQSNNKSNNKSDLSKFSSKHSIIFVWILFFKTQIQYFLESECDNNIWSDKNIHRYGSILTLFIWNLFKPIGSKFTVDPVISFVLNSISFDPDVRRPWAGMCNFSHTHNKRTLKTHITQNKLAHMVWANETTYLSLVSKTGSLSNFHHPY